MSKYQKIYVLAPYGGMTGGVELCHQLVDYLRKKAQNAFIVYVDTYCRPALLQNVIKYYEKYEVKTSNAIDDDPSNLLVVPEVFFDVVMIYTKIKIACWWMSVDNRYNRATLMQQLIFKKGILEKVGCIKNWLKRGMKSVCKNDNDILKKNDDRLIHLYQSTYAQHHLYNQNFSVVLPLSDFINTELAGNPQNEKNNIVLYNPAKGLKFTKKIISRLPNVKFIPLKGLTRIQLKELLETSKLYIDFGNFPGKDRLPREAVLNGCCIITGREGASYFYEDVPIRAFYKFDVKESNLAVITQRILYVLNHYEQCVKDFDEYKLRVSREQNLFYDEIERIFL